MTQDEAWLLKEKYNGEQTEGFFIDCKRLALGEPVAYVIGHIPFLDSTIYLDSHPLIPRTETEFWVEKTINEITARRVHSATPTFKILDLCAGSGCVGIAILRAIPTTTVDFAEIDVAHHATILKNIRVNDINESRTQVFGGDLFENITQRYDYILTNPPYIDSVLDRTQESVTRHEPHIALYGGKSGMEIISRIIESSPAFLENDGVLIIEHEPEQYEPLQAKAREAGFCMNTRCDQFGVKRYTRFVRNTH